MEEVSFIRLTKINSIQAVWVNVRAIASVEDISGGSEISLLSGKQYDVNENSGEIFKLITIVREGER